jgi:hypothetical protein
MSDEIQAIITPEGMTVYIHTADIPRLVSEYLAFEKTLDELKERLQRRNEDIGWLLTLIAEAGVDLSKLDRAILIDDPSVYARRSLTITMPFDRNKW